MKTKYFSKRLSNGEMNETQKEKQKVSLGTAAVRALVSFLPPAMLLGGILVTFYRITIRAERGIIEPTEPKVVDLQREIIVHGSQSIVSDVMILFRQEELEEVLYGDKEAKDKLANEFFAPKTAVYFCRYFELVYLFFSDSLLYLLETQKCKAITRPC